MDGISPIAQSQLPTDDVGPPEAKRTRLMKQIMTKALSTSASTATSQVISEIYGKFTSPNLESLLQDVLQSVTSTVEGEFDDILERGNVNDKLLRLEELIEESKNVDSKDKNVDDDDVAVESNKKIAKDKHVKSLPPGVSPSDVIRYKTHMTKLTEKERLLAETKTLEAELESINKEIEEKKKGIDRKVEEIGRQKVEMKRTADLCDN